MNETNTFLGALTKVLAIIGFLATIVLIVWLGVEGIKRAPSAFSSLASIAQSIQQYRPVKEITIATENSVVNSTESFEISWTDVKQEGEYTVSYACTPGVTVDVRDEHGVLVPLQCTDTLSFPTSVHELSLSVTSRTMRFTNVPITISFIGENEEVNLSNDINITVVNATIPVSETPVVVTPDVSDPKTEEEVAVTPKPTTPVYVAPIPQAPVITFIYPQSNPNGYIDLKMKTLGSGVLKNGVLTYTAKYDRDLRNAIEFDVKNIGTKTSSTWSFTIILPDGTTYTSPTQSPLKPQEHVTFTLGFNLDEDSNSKFAEISNTVSTKNDINTKNNKSVWNIPVQD